MKSKQDAERIQRLSEADAYKVKQQAEAEAYRVKQTGEAEAYRIKTVGESEADREARIGISKAIAASEQVNAYGGAKLKITQDVMNNFADAIKSSGVEIVPRTVITSGSGTGEDGKNIPNAFESLIMLLLSDKLTGKDLEAVKSSPVAEKLKKEIMDKIEKDNNETKM